MAITAMRDEDLVQTLHFLFMGRWLNKTEGILRNFCSIRVRTPLERFLVFFTCSCFACFALECSQLAAHD